MFENQREWQKLSKQEFELENKEAVGGGVPQGSVPGPVLYIYG